MNKEYFDSITLQVEDEPSCQMTLTYYLLVSSAGTECGGFNVYGVEIHKQAGAVAERKIIRDLFFKRGEAEEFLRLICRNQVTPMGLKYVVKDYVCDKIQQLSSGEGCKVTENLLSVL